MSDQAGAESWVKLWIFFCGGGSIEKQLAYLLPDPAAPGSIPSVPEISILLRLITALVTGKWKVA